MSSISTQCSTRSQLFPVEWPLTSKARQTPKKVEKHVQRTKGIKKRKERRHGSRLGASKPVCRIAVTVDQETQTENEGSGCQRDSRDVEHNTREASVGTNAEVMYEPKSPPGCTNIFETLNRDEASWLADEVHHVNKKVFGAEQTADKLKKNTDLDKKKASLNALQELLQDLRRNIKYPDEETARDLDSLNEASSNFGVRNIVNYLGLLNGYFEELHGQLDEQ